ncbi:hypothetical protein QLQ12_45150 [Actinoplanes sp. NEAU-A12]|uniref:Uncharacterized protein n=1 Tax=Actinoplanes sandaracinus TaxID=3045177 RepID=A0ABT6X1D2_9ACTN|nr:hypothetical protein [Actinoplanes sandaracinus]MDI6105789.1 hypothetical protein [Actinoplanes sandaracinus]
MAVLFELVVNFGANHAAAEQAHATVLNHPRLQAGEHQIPLHEPRLMTTRSKDGNEYLEMAVLPVGVGIGGAMDHGRRIIELTAEELSELGHGLYGLLRQLTGYHAAQVGWDPEGRVDLDELRSDWSDELATGRLPGLTLAEEIHQELQGFGFTRFAPGYVWIPYRGEQSSPWSPDQPA